MPFGDKVLEYLGLPTKRQFEELNEKVLTQEQLLNDNNSGNDISIGPTGLSSQAKESKVLEDVQGLVAKRVKIKSLQHLYISNQFVFRGVNVRAYELISRGYKIIGEDTVGVEACSKLVQDSGGENLFLQLSINTDTCGDGYLEKIPNKKGDKLMILKHINPLNFGFMTDPTTNNIIIGEDGTPKAYEQLYYDEQGKEVYVEVPKERIAHLIYNKIGDEFSGISTLQPVYNTAVRLMNMEQAAAEAAVKTANPLLVGNTESKSPGELAKWSKALDRISGKEQVFLPAGVKLTMLSPGLQNFSAYSNYFLDAVVSALGVPKAILTGSSGADSGNRSTVQTQSRHFYSMIRVNQKTIETLFNSIFEDYANRAGFKAPILVFGDIAEDADRNGQRATELYAAGLITVGEARNMIGLDSPDYILKELREKEIPVKQANPDNLDPEKPQTKEDIKIWNDGRGGTPLHPQQNIKAQQKLDPEVPSVK